MCGRYAASADPDELIEAFEVEVDATAERSRSLLVKPQDPPPGAPDYNMAPSKQAPVVLQRRPKGTEDEAAPPVRQLRLLTWGLVPSWAKDPSVGVRMINARAESVLEKPAFAKAALRRRCLVPARGWYEWQASPVATDPKGKPRKQPFFIAREDRPVLAFAGLYDFWRDPAADPADEDAWVVSYTVVTTGAEPGLDRVHDRQPLVLDPEQWQEWLDPGLTEPDDVRRLLQPHEPGRFVAWPVSKAVNTTANNGSALLDPVQVQHLDGVVDPMTGEVLGG